MYSHAPSTYTCPFCLMVEGVESEEVRVAQADIIYQSAKVTAFVSSQQLSTKAMNILIVPNEHFENIYALPDDYGIELQKAKRLVATALKQVYNCDGVSTRQHNEPAGSQDVWHYHEHVTPRFKNDFLKIKLVLGNFKREAKEQARAEHASKLREAISK